MINLALVSGYKGKANLYKRGCFFTEIYRKRLRYYAYK